MSFRLKLILGVVLIEGLLLAILMVGVFSHFQDFGERLMLDYARVKADDAAYQARELLRRREADALVNLAEDLGKDPDLAYVRIVDTTGRALAMAGLPPPGTPRRSGQALIDHKTGLIALGVDIADQGRLLGRLEMGVSASRAQRAFSMARERAGLVVLVGMLLVAAFSLGLGLYLSRRLKALEEGVRRLGRGDLGYQLEMGGRDELAAVADAFNAMSRQLLRDSRMEADFREFLQSREGEERRLLEARLEENASALVEAGLEFRRLVEALPAYVIRYDLEGRAVYVSPRFDEILESGAASLIGKRATEMALGRNSDLQRFQTTLMRVMATGNSEELELDVPERLGMRRHQVRIAPERDTAGRVLGALAVGLDVTETRQRDARLALLSFAMDQVTEAAMIVDEHARILYANRGAAAMLGIPAEELSTLDMARLRENFDAREWARFWEELRWRGSLTYETLNHRRGGLSFPVEVNANYFEVDGVGYDLALGRDLTERRRDESSRASALAEAERLAAAKSDFLANMSHELRTPLHVMLGTAQLGLRTAVDSQERARFGTILDTGQLMLALVDDILDFSKIEAGKLAMERTRLRLPDVLDQAVALVAARAHAKGLDLRVREAPDLPGGFLGDALRLVQVLMNLLSNAVKFTAAGRVELAVDVEGDRLRITVSDTGIGMDSAQMSRLFAPFEQADGSTTRKFGGTGLGLAICKRLVDLMGGDIEVEGAPGLGMTFRVRLPMPGREPACPVHATQRVWLSDALPDAESLRRELSRHGLEARVAALPQALGDAGALTILAPADAAISTLAEDSPPGSRVALLVSPGDHEAEELARRRGWHCLEWPPRARHVAALLDSGEAPVPAAAAATQARGRLAGVRILVAEDNAMNRVILEELLRMEEARVESVENGRDLWARVQRGPGDFDLILTDIQMPEMDGHDAARRIHALLPDLPIIGLTAHVLEDEKSRCLESGMVAHVGKPAQMDQLIRIMREHLPLGGRTTGPEVAPHAASGSAVIDWPAFEAQCQGKRALIFRACDLLAREHGETPGKLLELARRGELEALIRLAHNLKGMGANLHARALQENARELESVLKASGAAVPPGLVKPLAQALERVLEEAARYAVAE